MTGFTWHAVGWHRRDPSAAIPERMALAAALLAAEIDRQCGGQE